MGTLVFNWRGLFATVCVGIPVFWAVSQLENAGWTAAPALAFIAIGMTLPLSLLGYTIDRCDRSGVIRPYWENFMQLVCEMYSVELPEWLEYHPGRRTAFCVWPLALGPYIVLLIYLGVWLCAVVQGHVTWLLPQLLCVSAAAVGAALFAKATEWLRILPEWLDESNLVDHLPSDNFVDTTLKSPYS